MRILVINDDSEKTEVFELLVECFPLEVSKVQTGQGTAAQVKVNNPDVIVFDTFSPNDANISLCAQIRENTSSPILFASVINHPELTARALNSGADDVMVKPISKTLLMARLNGLIARSCGKKFAGRISLSNHFR